MNLERERRKQRQRDAATSVQGGDLGRFAISALMESPPEPPVMLAQVPFPIYEGSRHIIYGAPGLGKSLVSLWAAFMVAATGRTVLYFAGESSRYEFHARASALLAGLEQQLPSFDRAAAERGVIVDLQGADAMTFAQLEEDRNVLLAPRAAGLDMVIVDPLARFLAGDENSVEHTRPFFEMLDRVFIDAGITVLVVHHAGRVQSFKPAHMRGSSNIDAWPESTYRIHREEPSAPIITLYQEKCRNGIWTEPLAYTVTSTIDLTETLFVPQSPAAFRALHARAPAPGELPSATPEGAAARAEINASELAATPAPSTIEDPEAAIIAWALTLAVPFERDHIGALLPDLSSRQVQRIISDMHQAGTLVQVGRRRIGKAFRPVYVLAE